MYIDTISSYNVLPKHLNDCFFQCQSHFYHLLFQRYITQNFIEEILLNLPPGKIFMIEEHMKNQAM